MGSISFILGVTLTAVAGVWTNKDLAKQLGQEFIKKVGETYSDWKERIQSKIQEMKKKKEVEEITVEPKAPKAKKSTKSKKSTKVD